jgi:hypothetical protein
MDPEIVVSATPTPVDPSTGWNTAVTVLTDLLQKATDGAVSSQAVRKELESRECALTNPVRGEVVRANNRV